MRLKIMTPEKLFYSEAVEMVIVEGTVGKEGYMAGHSPVIKLLKEGNIRIREAECREEKTLAAGKGYMIMDGDLMIFISYASWENV